MHRSLDDNTYCGSKRPHLRPGLFNTVISRHAAPMSFPGAYKPLSPHVFKTTRQVSNQTHPHSRLPDPRKGCLTQWLHPHPFSLPTQRRLPSTLQRPNESHHSDRKTTRPRSPRCRASTASLLYPHHPLPSYHPPRNHSPANLPRHLASLSPPCHPYPRPELPYPRNGEMMKGQRSAIPPRFGIDTDRAAE
jgi:hypothetical protein